MNRPDYAEIREDGEPLASSVIQVDRDALRRNIEALQTEMAPARLCFVVKADAYGHGVEAVVPVAEAAGIRDFAVFSSHEASHVHQASDGKSAIQIMGHMWPEDFQWAAENGLHPWINDVADWEECKQAVPTGARLGVHLEIETGMKRTGLSPENALTVAKEVADDDRFDIKGLCTHLAGAEDSRNADRVQAQLDTFASVCDEIRATGIEIPVRHVSSSSAALVAPELRMEMVRVGIAAYGLWPTQEVKQRYLATDPDPPLELSPVMTWRTCIMALQDVEAGEYVGYGKSYCSPRDTRIAILPVGYSDGFSRGLSNAGQVLIRGIRCPIVGTVNMNMVHVDVGHIQDIEVGEDVVLIGQMGDESITVASFAEAQAVVNYELMVRLSQDVPRVLR